MIMCGQQNCVHLSTIEGILNDNDFLSLKQGNFNRKIRLIETDNCKRNQFGGDDIILTAEEATALVNGKLEYKNNSNNIYEFKFNDGIRYIPVEDYKSNILRQKNKKT